MVKGDKHVTLRSLEKENDKKAINESDGLCEECTKLCVHIMRRGVCLQEMAMASKWCYPF